MNTINMPKMGILGLMPEALNSSAATPTLPTMPVQTDSFQSLLSLVQDTEIGDFQSSDGKDFLNQEVLSLKNQGQRELELGQNLAQNMAQNLAQLQANLASNQPANLNNNVGHGVSPRETNSGNDLWIGAQGLETLSKSELRAATQTQAGQNGEAVEQWAAAFAVGDIKDVSVSNEGAPSFAQALKGAPEKSTKLGAAGNLGTGAKIMEPKGPMTSATEAAASQVKADSAASLPAHAQVKVGLETKSELPAGPKVALDNAKANSAASSKSQNSSEMGSGNKEGKSFGEKGSAKSQSGADFLLGNAHDKRALVDSANSQSYAQQVRSNAAPKTALVGAAALGDVNDNRISKNTLDHVTEKIESLKNAGGGTVKVDLHPKDLGAVEIRVSMRQGVLQVKLSAEKPSTQAALDASKGELLGKLSLKSETVIDVGTLQNKGAQVEALALDKVKSPHTDSFLAVQNGGQNSGQNGMKELQNAVGRDASRTGQATHENGVVKNSGSTLSQDFVSDMKASGESIHTGKGGGASSSNLADSGKEFASKENPGSFDEQSRRDEAMNQWEDFFTKEKKSA